MNGKVEVLMFQAMIQNILQLTLQWLLIHTYLSKSTFEGDVFICIISEYIF
jgi:hypothetical protein